MKAGVSKIIISLCGRNKHGKALDRNKEIQVFYYEKQGCRTFLNVFFSTMSNNTIPIHVFVCVCTKIKQ